MNQSKEKWEKPHFYAFLRGLRGLKGIKIIPKNGLKVIKGLNQKSAWNISGAYPSST